VKSGATIASDYAISLNRVAGLVADITARLVVYGGVERQSRSGCEIFPLSDVKGVLESFARGRAVGGKVDGDES
jgi:hypothetical protein